MTYETVYRYVVSTSHTDNVFLVGGRTVHLYLSGSIPTRLDSVKPKHA